MPAKSILSYFSAEGVPSTGLSPTIKIRDVVDGSLLVSESAMSEVGDGFYRYTFSQYNVTGTYSIRADGGKTLGASDRFQVAGNESFADDIWQQPTASQDVTGTMGRSLNFLYDVEGGRWLIDESVNQIIFFKDDNVTEVARFNLLDITGSAGYQNPFERVRV